MEPKIIRRFDEVLNLSECETIIADAINESAEVRFINCTFYPDIEEINLRDFKLYPGQVSFDKCMFLSAKKKSDEKKMIWVYAADYDRLKECAGKPGESVADWSKRALDIIESQNAALKSLMISHRTNTEVLSQK